MPNIAAVLKSEIARVARKEVRAATAGLVRTNGEQRKNIAAMRRQLVELQRAVKQLQRARKSSPSTGAKLDEESVSALRWRPEGFAQHRKRLGISAEQMARLIGCSALSIYKWESGKVRPRQAQLAAIAQVRQLSKSEARKQLEEAD